MSISIAQAKQIRETLGMTHLVIFAISEDGVYHVATHGQTEVHAKQAAQAGNNLKKALGWDKELCKSKPLERKCSNCAYSKEWPCASFSDPNYTCHLEPKPIDTQPDSKCRHFEPAY